MRAFTLVEVTHTPMTKCTHIQHIASCHRYHSYSRSPHIVHNVPIKGAAFRFTSNASFIAITNDKLIAIRWKGLGVLRQEPSQ